MPSKKKIICVLCGNDAGKIENIIPGLKSYTCDYCATLSTKNTLSMINADRQGFTKRIGGNITPKMLSKIKKWYKKNKGEDDVDE